jgi:hypothetical protein
MRNPDEYDLILALLAALLMLIIGLQLAHGQAPMPPPMAATTRTNYRCLAVTAVDVIGLESDYSKEVTLTNWSLWYVPLAWDPVANAAGYRLYWGTASRQYTHTNDAGNGTNYTLLLAQPVTNAYTIRPMVSTNLVNWATNGILWRFTNITASGDMFWRLQISTNL